MSEPAAKQRQMIDLEEFERRLARPKASGSGEDPLAELARLVGQGDDRFERVFQQRPSASAPASSARREPKWPSPHAVDESRHSHPFRGDFAAIEAGLRGSIAPEFAARPASAPADDIDGDSWFDAPYVPAAKPQPPLAEPSRSRLPLYATAAVVIFGIAGIGATFALKRTPHSPQEIAMISAAPGPIKIRASSADISKVNQDASILDNSPQPTPQAVVNRVEQPVSLPAQPALQSAAATPAQTPPQSPAQANATPVTGAAVVPVPSPPPLDATANPAFSLAGMIQPKKVRTVSVRPDGSIVAENAPADQAAPAAAPASVDATQVHQAAMPADDARSGQDAGAAPPRADDPVAPAARESVARSNRSSHSRSEKVAEAEDNRSETASNAAKSASGSFDVQLAAAPSEAEARKAMAKLQHQFGSALAGHRLKYHEASVANKSVYRVRAVGLTHEAATALCVKLQASGGKCFVARD